MPNETYELIALGARYWFVFLGVVIAWRSYAWLLSDNRVRKCVLRNLPDAGTVGEIVDLDTGDTYPLPREGVLGSGTNCDIRLRGLRWRHAQFSFLDGRGVQLIPRQRSAILIDGQPVRKGGYATHGTRIETGGYALRVRLFAGLNVPRPAVYTHDTALSEGQGMLPEPQFAPEDDSWASEIPDEGYLPPGYMPVNNPQPPADLQITWQYAPSSLPPSIPAYEESLELPDETDDPFPLDHKAIRRFGSKRRGRADG